MEQNVIKASVVIRAYNAEATIARSLVSALAQDFREPYEVVVVDDGSTDNTTSIVEQLSDERVRIIRQENKGAAAAANTGFKSAGGEVVVLLDSDDEALPIMLSAAAVPLCENPNLAYTYPDYYEEYEGTRKLIQTTSPFSAIAGGMAWRKEAFLSEGGFAENTIFPEYDLLLRAWGRWMGRHIATPVMIYHRRKESLAGNQKEVDRSLEMLRRKYPNLGSEIKKIRSYAL